MSTTTLSPPTISPEVRTFAIEQGVEGHLPKIVALAQRLFPAATTRIHVEADPELADNREIVFEVCADGLDEEEQCQLQQQWTRDLFQECPTSHVHLFCLILRHSA